MQGGTLDYRKFLKRRKLLNFVIFLFSRLLGGLHAIVAALALLSDISAAVIAAASPSTANQMWCGICWDLKHANDFQELNCKHSVCSQCLSASMGSLCPIPMCCKSRTTDIVVDEGVDDSPINISFGANVPSTLDLEEKMKCEAIRGHFACSNVARVVLMDCRHRMCFDCLAQRVEYANKQNEMPNCAHQRCANQLSRGEVKRIAGQFPSMEKECDEMMKKMPAENEEDTKGHKDEILVFCSIVGKEHTMKRLSIPKNCSVVDMLNAILQLQKLTRNRSTSSFGIYVMRDIENNKIKYECLNPKSLGRKTVKDMNFTEKTHFVVDLDNQLARRK